MKASELVKVGMTIESIYNIIDRDNKDGRFKSFIPHYQYVEDSVKLQLIKDGFKVYVSNWDAHMTNALTIEW